MSYYFKIITGAFILIIGWNSFTIAQQLKTGGVKFINYYYENASPLIWNAMGDSAIKIEFLYDYERGSVNRQSTHFNFKIEAETGTTLNLILSGFRNIYNGRINTSYGRQPRQNISCYFSEDYQNWEGVETTPVLTNNFDLQVKYQMKSETVYLAKIPVYSLSHLEDFRNKIVNNKLVKIIPLGMTVEKRPLEIIRIGNPNAEKSVLIRARAHPWEPGGNWVIEGLVNDFIENAGKWHNKFCYYIMPMANKDGVFRGMTRFNVNGSDLNRGWGFEADSILTPENYYLEKFIKKLIVENKRPDFLIDFHNDSYGNIHVSRPKENDVEYGSSMDRFYEIMKAKTWFTGQQQKVYTDDPKRYSIAAGLYERYDITGCVLELNAERIDKLNKLPSVDDWKQLGKDLNEVFYQFFKLD
ncbi:M14 family zinc carboxypeptidase [Draconibacterium sp.]|nr:M14 family zinc carboxypeptidase [Draconibacterium sp.]